MKLIRYLIYIAIFLYFIGFSLLNGQKVAVSLPFTEKPVEAYFFVFIYISLILGLLTGYIIASRNTFSGWVAKREKEKENKKLQGKIDLYETEIKIYDNIRESNKQLRLSNISQFLLPKK